MNLTDLHCGKNIKKLLVLEHCQLKTLSDKRNTFPLWAIAWEWKYIEYKIKCSSTICTGNAMLVKERAKTFHKGIYTYKMWNKYEDFNNNLGLSWEMWIQMSSLLWNHWHVSQWLPSTWTESACHICMQGYHTRK